ncbi:MAG: 3,5-cyclic-AMP phosphodiesterase [Clostridiales bacterium]|jgi:hypothetical protein|nr:3,5-cyclic-AMP phosphodiesterase [Clostridiales bacterium]MDN5280888.1 3,5-cyclic-AMP phosphodiesterase [Candidatus Ozemobacter sp.]
MSNSQHNCIALLGDPHLPGRNLELKKKVISDVNSWSDVDLVVCTGDLCATYGTEEEFRFAADFFKALNKPFFTLIGNHDNYYSDRGYIKASVVERKEKIDRFRRFFPRQKLYFSCEFAGFRLIFLALDDLESSCFSSLSSDQLDWFASELQKWSDDKTIVFCHAPLWGEEVIRFYPPAVNYIAQPVQKIRSIVMNHKQLVLWVSGHVHFGMKKELINHPFNLFLERILNILNCDMDGFSVLDSRIKPEFHDRIWTRKLFLRPDGFRCTVYDHKDDLELTELEMTGEF